jgi:hypothetical protein
VEVTLLAQPQHICKDGLPNPQCKGDRKLWLKGKSYPTTPGTRNGSPVVQPTSWPLYRLVLPFERNILYKESTFCAVDSPFYCRQCVQQIQIFSLIYYILIIIKRLMKTIQFAIIVVLLQTVKSCLYVCYVPKIILLDICALLGLYAA